MQRRYGLMRLVILITFLAGWLRLYAARNLYGDNDESTYMTTSVGYARIIRSGEYLALIDYDLTSEHPSLYKILYGVALLAREPVNTFSNRQLPLDKPVTTSDAVVWILTDRYLSGLFGTIAVAILAIINPLAGLFLAVNTLSVKYTSEVYLESLPMLTSLLCGITYLHWFNQNSNLGNDGAGNNRWLIASSFFLGLTAASKYAYCIIGIVVIIHFVLALYDGRVSPRLFFHMIAWGLLAFVVFFMFNPYLWHNPIAKLTQSIDYHMDYSRSEYVIKSQYPYWQPFRWLFSFSRFYDLGPRSAFIFDIDTPVFVLAVIGLPRLFQKKRFYFYWLIVALIFLLVWNTKWPQYTLIVLVPLCISASEGATTAWVMKKKFFDVPEDFAL